MTVLDALSSINTYPIPVNTIEKICIDRGLTSSDPYTKEIGESEAYELANADVLLYLYTAPDLKEQNVSITQGDRDNFLSSANFIYGKYEDPKFTGITYGFIGDSFNG